MRISLLKIFYYILLWIPHIIISYSFLFSEHLVEYMINGKSSVCIWVFSFSIGLSIHVVDATEQNQKRKGEAHIKTVSFYVSKLSGNLFNGIDN